jgi:hypothetical protein
MVRRGGGDGGRLDVREGARLRPAAEISHRFDHVRPTRVLRPLHGVLAPELEGGVGSQLQQRPRHLLYAATLSRLWRWCQVGSQHGPAGYIPETAHMPTLETHQLPSGSSTHKLWKAFVETINAGLVDTSLVCITEACLKVDPRRGKGWRRTPL